MTRRGFGKVAMLVAIAAALLAVGGGYIVLSQKKATNENKIEFQNQYGGMAREEILLDIERELEMAAKSGGITSENYDLFAQRLFDLETEGADPAVVASLRVKLGALSVGGKAKESAVASVPETTPPPQDSSGEPVKTPPAAKAVSSTPQTNTTSANTTLVRPFWHYTFTDNKWVWAREGAPPSCSEPLILPSPIDLDLVAGILYPGQVRGNGPADFKPHGGFQLKPGSPIEIRAPMDGYLTNVAKFTDEFGLHYSLIFQHPCGIQFGGGHWGVLPPDIEAIMDKVPLRAYGDSRTTLVPEYFVKKGQIIVTGLQEKADPERPGFDWGVADYRQENKASKDLRFRELYGTWWYNTFYGVCWIDWLPADQKSIVKSFPGVDMKSGKYSEYCE